MDAAALDIRDGDGGAILPVKVVPGASRDRLVGVLGDALKVATSAPPEKGKANAAVAAALAKAIHVNRRDVQLVSGPTNPRKEFRIAGLTAEQLRTELAGLGTGD